VTRVPPDRSLLPASQVVDDPLRRARYQALAEEVHRGTRDLSANEQSLVLSPAFAALFESRGLQYGNTVLIGGAQGQGATSLALGLCAGSTRAKHWVGILNLSRVSLLSASELGVALDHLVLIPHPIERVAGAASILMEACSLVLLGADQPVSAHDARRLQRRAREYRCVLLVLAPSSTRAGSSLKVTGQRHWPEIPDTLIEVTKSSCVGIGHGEGHLAGRQIRVEITYRRGSPVREVYELVLPGAESCLPLDGEDHVPVHIGLHGVGLSDDGLTGDDLSGVG